MYNQQYIQGGYPMNSYQNLFNPIFGASYNVPSTNYYSPLSPNVIPFGSFNVLPHFPFNQAFP